MSKVFVRSYLVVDKRSGESVQEWGTNKQDAIWNVLEKRGYQGSDRHELIAVRLNAVKMIEEKEGQ